MSQVRGTIKSAAEAALVRLPRRTRRGDRLILAYHNVVPAGTTPLGDRSLHMPLDRFERQLDMVRREADIVPLLDLLSREAPNERRAAITFDDAYGSALQLGVYTCVSQNIACTIFVAPSLLGSMPEWDIRAELGRWTAADREYFLNDEHGLARTSVGTLRPDALSDLMRVASEALLSEVAELHGVKFGNHTMRHPNLSVLPEALAIRELADAQTWLCSRFPHLTIPVVAYPFGLYPPSRQQLLSACGAHFGLAVVGGWLRGGDLNDSTALSRWNVPASLSLDGFRLRLRGWLN